MIDWFLDAKSLCVKLFCWWKDQRVLLSPHIMMENDRVVCVNEDISAYEESCHNDECMIDGV